MTASSWDKIKTLRAGRSILTNTPGTTFSERFHGVLRKAYAEFLARCSRDGQLPPVEDTRTNDCSSATPVFSHVIER